MNGASRCVIAAVVLFFATSLAGQATTGTLVGRVTANGAPLPGVLVVITSPALLGMRVVTTADDGQYLAPALPPGDYAIRFEMDGMEPLDQRATLPLGQMTRVDGSMTPAAFEADINVIAAAPTLLETPQVSTNFTGETMELLPTGRGILDAVRLAPGVTLDGGGFASIGRMPAGRPHLQRAVQRNRELPALAALRRGKEHVRVPEAADVYGVGGVAVLIGVRRAS